MKAKSCIYFLFIICISCVSSQIATINSGYFQYVEDDLTKTIVLKNDYQFTYIESLGRVDAKCVGKWKYISKDTILLQCEDEPLENAFVQGYMPTRNHKIEVLNANKLKLLCDNNAKHKYFVLNRVDSLHQK
jgi:hypothetical protein